MYGQEHKFKFAFVSNSAEIARAVKLEAELGMDEVTMRLATMEQALPVARTLLEEGVEVIIGGGATGRLLRRTLHRPVVTIARTDLDIIKALLKAKEFGPDIGLTSFAAPTEGARLYEELLGIRIRQIVFKTTPELEAAIGSAVADGVDCIVGSGICKQIAGTYGGKGVVVVPNREVIIRALDEARAIAGAQREERERAERLRVVLETITEAVIGIDDTGRVTIINQDAARKFSLDAGEILGESLPEIVKGTGLMRVLKTGRPEVDRIRRIAGMDVVINASPIVLNDRVCGVVGTFKLGSRIQTIDRKLKERLYHKGFRAKYGLGHLKGDSRSMCRLRDRAERYARTDAAILIQGESGTGKEIVAQAIHLESHRRDRPFVAVNCSALTETLLESELFGYEEGAFTGAKRGGKIGLFELATTGTIFLDEIADISPAVQVRLLRVLEEKEVMRVGGDRIVPVDVRIISSSHKDLAVEVRNGNFRSDLFFRLSVLRLELPSLRERAEDIPVIARELLARNGASADLLSDSDLERLKEYAWPGNVRELDALLKRYDLLSYGQEPAPKLLEEILEEIRSFGLMACTEKGLSSGVAGDDPMSLKEMMEEYEREVILEVLRASRHSRRETAKRLGISVNTLWRKLKQ